MSSVKLKLGHNKAALFGMGKRAFWDQCEATDCVTRACLSRAAARILDRGGGGRIGQIKNVGGAKSSELYYSSTNESAIS